MTIRWAKPSNVYNPWSSFLKLKSSFIPLIAAINLILKLEPKLSAKLNYCNFPILIEVTRDFYGRADRLSTLTVLSVQFPPINLESRVGCNRLSRNNSKIPGHTVTGKSIGERGPSIGRLVGYNGGLACSRRLARRWSLGQ
jgi:hypothetical protein